MMMYKCTIQKNACSFRRKAKDMPAFMVLRINIYTFGMHMELFCTKHNKSYQRKEKIIANCRWFLEKFLEIATPAKLNT